MISRFTANNKVGAGDKIRLYGVIAACIAVLTLAIWVSLKENSSKGNGVPVVADTISSSQAALADLPNAEKPTFDVVRISRGGSGVIAGRARPGAIVELYSNEKLIARVTADEKGDWVAILSEPLAPGSAELNLIARNAQNNESHEADKVVVISVPEREKDIFIEQKESGVVAVLSSKDGTGPSKIMQRPASGFREVGDSLSISTIDYTSAASAAEGKAIVAGQALPRVEVRLYLDTEFVGAMKVHDDGNWQLLIDHEKLGSGTHVLRADQVVSDGSVQLRIEQPFEMGEPLDPSTAKGGVIVKPGNTLWHIARQLYGSGVRYTLIFIENSDQIRDPDKIYPGQIFSLPGKRSPKEAKSPTESK